MKSFLTKTGIYFSIVITFLFVFQQMIDFGLKRSDKVPYKQLNEVKRGKINASVLFLGSSRIKKHLNAKEFESITGASTYNMGTDGTNIFMQEAIWNFYKSTNRSPKLLVIEFDMIRLEKDKIIFNKERFLPYYTNSYFLNAFAQIPGFNCADVLIPFYKYHGYTQTVYTGFNSLFNSRSSALDNDKGFEPLVGLMDVDSLPNKKSIEINMEEVEASLARILVLSKAVQKLGGELILINTPRYRGGQNNILNRERINNLLQDFVDGNQLTFYDFEKGEKFINSPKLFFDTEHLNEAGALLLTKEFASRLTNF